MPFGAANAPNEFMRPMVNLLFEHIVKGYCIVFIADIMIYSRNDEDHEHHVRAVMDTIRKPGFRLHVPSAHLDAHWPSSSGLTLMEMTLGEHQSR